jgi:hypothetical protein
MLLVGFVLPFFRREEAAATLGVLKIGAEPTPFRRT